MCVCVVCVCEREREKFLTVRVLEGPSLSILLPHARLYSSVTIAIVSHFARLHGMRLIDMLWIAVDAAADGELRDTGRARRSPGIHVDTSAAPGTKEPAPGGRRRQRPCSPSLAAAAAVSKLYSFRENVNAYRKATGQELLCRCMIICIMSHTS